MHLCFIEEAKSWRYRVHVCFFYTTFRCFFVGVSACSGVTGSVCVRICKDAGVWLVILARPKWHDVNAFQLGLQNSTPVIVVT